MSDSKLEMILCIVNSGHSQDVMDSAKKAGARGGTVIKARGSANPKAEELYGIPIQPEKEIVMIIVKSEIKDSVLKNLFTDCGLDNDGQGIAFSVPVSDSVGISV